MHGLARGVDGSDGVFSGAQECVVRAFGVGTGAFALWVDTGSRGVRAPVRRADGGAAHVR